MKFIQLYPNSQRGGYNVIPRFLKALPFLTQTLTSQASREGLYKRISPAGNPRVSIVPILDQWVAEGRYVDRGELKTIVKILRKDGRFAHALLLSEWMSVRRYLDLSPEDVATRLNLVSRVHGLNQAEQYFGSLPDSLKTFKVYGALLHCYTHNQSVEKAETMMLKMRQFGYLRTMSYNVMLTLYCKMGNHEQVDKLIGDMEKMGVNWDKSTFYIRLNAYASTSDIQVMEGLLKKMEANPQIMDWNAYLIPANGYLKVGLVEKALEMVKKSEQLIRGRTMVRGRTRGFAYQTLLTFYAKMGNKDELFRVWRLYRKRERIHNKGYFLMISSLFKLDDIDGAEKIFEQWELKGLSFDFRIPNLLINGYCRNGLIKKAEIYVNRLIEYGKQPPASTWDRLATEYYKDNQMDKAVEMMKKAILAYQGGWRLNRVTLSACLNYVKLKGDVEAAEFLKLLKEDGYISQNTYQPGK